VFTNIAPGSADVVRPWVEALRNVGFAVFAKPKIDEDSDVDSDMLAHIALRKEQGLAAVAVADPERRFGDDVIAMAEAAAATRWAQVTIADQEALTSAGRCRPGDALGSAEGDVVVVGPDVPEVACELLDRLLGAGGELATLVVGDDRELGDAVCAHLAAIHPTVEVARYDGGPAGVLLLVGVE
jgi:dihydroxyacetone kinase-like predicted kinase